MALPNRYVLDAPCFTDSRYIGALFTVALFTDAFFADAFVTDALLTDALSPV